jgi:signal transduction histidine kinase
MEHFLRTNRVAIIENALARIQSRSGPGPSEDELAGVPLFLDQLIGRLRADQDPTLDSSPGIEETAPSRGRSYLRPGVGVVQIVHDYGAICQSVGDLAVARGAEIGARGYQILNQALDDAIAGALSEYTARREQNRAQQEREEVGILAHELRNALSGVAVGVTLLKRGQVPPAGKTMEVIERNLSRAQALIDTSMAGVRLAAADMAIQRFSLADLLEDIELPMVAEADRRGIRLHVKVESGVVVEGDRHLLVAAASNLVQNALKFTPSGGAITIEGKGDAISTTITVDDQCGGLPPGKPEDLFRPFFQGGSDRSGVGLGLTIVRRTMEAHGGSVRVQDRPGIGCQFTIEIPSTPPAPGSKAPRTAR